VKSSSFSVLQTHDRSRAAVVALNAEGNMLEIFEIADRAPQNQAVRIEKNDEAQKEGQRVVAEIVYPSGGAVGTVLTLRLGETTKKSNDARLRAECCGR
jgi:hypothetical protein